MKITPSDHLCTPERLLVPVRAMGVIALDPCSNPNSLVGANSNLMLEYDQDGLAADWLAACAVPLEGDGLVFVNPPYSQGHLRLWTTKIRNEAARGCEIVSLLPTDPTTRWWATINGSCDARCLVRERVAFVGGWHRAGLIRSTFFYHGPRRYLFAHHMEALGEVLVRDRKVA